MYYLFSNSVSIIISYYYDREKTEYFIFNIGGWISDNLGQRYSMCGPRASVSASNNNLSPKP